MNAEKAWRKAGFREKDEIENGKSGANISPRVAQVNEG